ncbi:hypothetical protein [Cerasicoccus fimbriatus]|uniref:hypothetical protein n=1 Tax=Cerasicoccus fimbriatus TaxID=3014554 RepID=UPI0022B2DA29|nr:hypothetical protein [Cerasicoccus sp. TK19100]
MALTTQQRIQLQELLLQREALYARIARTEAKIHEIFGEEYPLPPPDVDVATPGKKPSKAKKKAARASGVRIRTLDPGETGYQVTFSAEGGGHTETHHDRKTITGFVESPLLRLITRVETVDSDGSVVETLYTAPPSDSES